MRRKQIFFPLFVVLVFLVSSTQTFADSVTYSFAGVSYSSHTFFPNRNQSFSFVVPTFIAGYTLIDSANMTACDAGSGLYGCKSAWFAPSGAMHDNVSYDLMGLEAWSTTHDSWYEFYYYFPLGSFGASGVYSATLFGGEAYQFFQPGTGTLTVSVSSAVPEPTTILLLGLGLIGLVGIRRKM